MKAVVFLGPTLPVETAKRYVNAEFLAPVQQGDILRALRDRPYALGIIDGYFDTVPSVWHKEILTALEEGVHVLGAASMGALRAAELAPFGMTGVGEVFERFRSGELTDDDEVAVVHTPADQGFRPLSEAMVNIRELCEAAERDGVVDRRCAGMLISIAKSLHYSHRRWEEILAQAEQQGMSRENIEGIKSIRAAKPWNAKQRDAIALLKGLSKLLDEPARSIRAEWNVEQTVFLANLKREIAREAAPEMEEAPGTQLNVARKKVLLGVLASREAVRRGLAIRPADVSEMTKSFRSTYDLLDDDKFGSWRVRHMLTWPDLQKTMHRFTEVIRVEEDSRAEIDAELDNYLRVYSAAAQNQQESAEWLQLNIALERGGAGPESHARILLGRLQTALPELRRNCGLQQFHFVRKPPDVRLRLRAVQPDHALVPRLRRLLSKLHQRGCIVSAHRSIYEPEARVFGGMESAAAVHEYFQRDSINWIQWEHSPAAERTISAEQLCASVMNDLFWRVLHCANEVWDIWTKLVEDTRTCNTPEPGPITAHITAAELAHDASGRLRAVLKSYLKANQELAASIQATWSAGSLSVGIRTLLAMIAMFHFNRFGFAGAKQASIAAAAARAWHPDQATAVGQV